MTDRSLAARIHLRTRGGKHAAGFAAGQLAMQHGSAVFGQPTHLEVHRDGEDRVTVHFANGGRAVAYPSGEVELHHPTTRQDS